jgi:hypothetical protein
VTKLGRLVKDGKIIKSLEDIYLFSIAIKEAEIIDYFLGESLRSRSRPRYGLRAQHRLVAVSPRSCYPPLLDRQCLVDTDHRYCDSLCSLHRPVSAPASARSSWSVSVRRCPVRWRTRSAVL